MDVQAALLNSERDEEIYMQQADGFACKDQLDMVSQLRKGVYDLKQAALCWNKTIDQVMLIHASTINALKFLIQNL